MSVIVTKHAEKRLKERIGLNKKSIQRAAEIAFDKVRPLETLISGLLHCILTRLRHILSEYMRESGYDVKEILVCKGKPPKVIGGGISGVSS